MWQRLHSLECESGVYQYKFILVRYLRFYNNLCIYILFPLLKIILNVSNLSVPVTG